jgi:hypothetical protein
MGFQCLPAGALFRAARSQNRHATAMFVRATRIGCGDRRPHGMRRMARARIAYPEPMNAAVAILLLAAPFAVLAAVVAVLIVYLGNRTK